VRLGEDESYTPLSIAPDGAKLDATPHTLLQALDARPGDQIGMPNCLSCKLAVDV